MLTPFKLVTATASGILASVMLLACDGDPVGQIFKADLPPLEIQTQTFLSGAFVVDQIYPSMKGPMEMANVKIGGEGPPERIWVIAYETEIVDPATGDVLTENFMCHNNLNFESLRDHLRKMGTRPAGRPSARLFTLSQGAMGIEFPDGFGVPMMSNEKMQLSNQVLNLNPVDQTRQVQYRTTVRYVRDVDARGRLRPLYQRGVQGLKLISGVDGYYGIDDGNPEEHGQGCSMGVLAGQQPVADNQGRQFAAHWFLEPGVEESHTLATDMLALQQDTTVHYIAAHLHPFAESLELRDLTTGKSVFKSMATNSVGRIGLDHVEFYSSEEGIPLYKDHEYTLVSTYDNTSGEQQDAMAVMFVYMLDKNYDAKLAANEQVSRRLAFSSER